MCKIDLSVLGICRIDTYSIHSTGGLALTCVLPGATLPGAAPAAAVAEAGRPLEVPLLLLRILSTEGERPLAEARGSRARMELAL